MKRLLVISAREVRTIEANIIRGYQLRNPICGYFVPNKYWTGIAWLYINIIWYAVVVYGWLLRCLRTENLIKTGTNVSGDSTGTQLFSKLLQTL